MVLLVPQGLGDSSVRTGLNIPPWKESQSLKCEFLAKVEIKSKGISQTDEQNHCLRAAAGIQLCISHLSS